MQLIAVVHLSRTVKLSVDRSFGGYSGEYSDRRNVGEPARMHGMGLIMPR